MQDFIRLAESLTVRLHPVDADRLRGMAGTDRHQGRGGACATTSRRRSIRTNCSIASRARQHLLLVLDKRDRLRTTSAPVCAWPMVPARTR